MGLLRRWRAGGQALPAAVVRDRAFVETLLRYCRYAAAAYDMHTKVFEGIALEDVIHGVWKSSLLVPGVACTRLRTVNTPHTTHNPPPPPNTHHNITHTYTHTHHTVGRL